MHNAKMYIVYRNALCMHKSTKIYTMHINMNTKLYANSVYPIYQPLRSGRIWHKVNFLSGV